MSLRPPPFFFNRITVHPNMPGKYLPVSSPPGTTSSLPGNLTELQSLSLTSYLLNQKLLGKSLTIYVLLIFHISLNANKLSLY